MKFLMIEINVYKYSGPSNCLIESALEFIQITTFAANKCALVKSRIISKCPIHVAHHTHNVVHDRKSEYLPNIDHFMHIYYKGRFGIVSH